MPPPYTRGKMAFENGDPIYTNPFCAQEDAFARAEWERGWKDGEKESYERIAALLNREVGI